MIPSIEMKKLAPHVQAAIAKAAQAKRPADAARPVASHVQQAVAAAAQPKLAPRRDPPAPVKRPPAPPPLASRPAAGTTPGGPRSTVQMSQKQLIGKKRKPSTRSWELRDQIMVEGASGHTGSGYKLVGEGLNKRKRTSRYKTSRIEQILGQISTLTYFMLKGDEKVTEVEAMWAGGCVFLSCNLSSATAALYDKLALTKSDDLWKQVVKQTGGKNSKSGKITGRMAEKIRQVRNGTRDVGKEPKKVLKTFRKNDLAWIDLSHKDAGFYAACLLAVGGFTVVVFGPNKRHAEVKLVKALEVAKYKGKAIIQGKKRPCYTCAAYMRVRKRKGYGLVFSDNPGKLWKDEYDRSEPEVQKEVRTSIKKKRQMNVSLSGEQYRSDSESDSSDSEDE